jgi:VIT1/CCC1 family predicted Fe2+/Mn2+ transporter
MNVSASIAGSASAIQGPGAVLSPVDRISEIQFGLIMALTFTGTLSVATAERSEVREMLIGALGCNIAWGLVDAVMFLLAALAERGRNIAVLNEVRKAADPARARALILDAMPPLLASTLQPTEVDTIRERLLRLPEPGRLSLAGADFRMAVAVFFLVFLATLPVALPFAFIDEAHRALRVSNGIALAMLFLGGYYLGGHAGRRPWVSGLLMLAIGVLLVWATIALGG